MANVYFVQYLRPDGRKTVISIDRPDHIANIVTNINEHGFRLECEVLTTGDVSMSVSDDFGDYAHLLAPNDKTIPSSVDELITSFKLAEALKWREINKRQNGAQNGSC